MSRSMELPGRSPSVGSQSLFNIYYLGNTPVDRRCSSAIMPWIIEELKLKADEMKFIWLSPGSEGVSFVADNGEELFGHSYGNILQCCLAMDGISFAYIVRQKEEYFCHVFQALTYEEAAKIMVRFKQQAEEEIAVPAMVTHNLRSSSSSSLPLADMKSSGYIISSHNGPPSSGSSGSDEYRLEYLGKHQVPLTASNDSMDQVELIDALVAKVREATRGKGKGRKKGFGSRFRGKNAKPPLPVGTNEGVVLPGSEDVRDSRHSSYSSYTRHASSSSSSSSERQSEVDINITSSSPLYPKDHTLLPPNEDLPGGGCGVPEDSSSSQENSPELREKKPSSEFDTIPELANLQASTEFQALSNRRGVAFQKVRLLFTGVSVVVLTEDTGEIVLKKSVKSIACCAQGKRSSEYLAFSSRSKENKKTFCYLFLSKSSRMAIKVLESFKSAFVHALAVTMPPALCDTCPLKQMQDLCKKLEGISTQVAQSKIQECLTTFNEADYNRIMLLYKASEHADHDYTQIIVLVSLLRHHFHSLQAKHTHHGSFQSKQGLRGQKPQRDPDVEEATGRLRLPSLARAKMAITSSFENLRVKPGQGQEAKKQQRVGGDGGSEGDEFKVRDVKSNSLNLQSPSPLFSRKTNITTLMNPIVTSPKRETAVRQRAWTAGERVPLTLPGEDREESVLVSEESALVSNTLVSNTGPAASLLMDDDDDTVPEKAGVYKTPQRSHVFRSLREGKLERHSLTPPSSQQQHHYRTNHRRTTSHVITRSWRQEIFDSVSTPTKLDRKAHRPSSDILEDWQVIELSGKSWKQVHVPTKARKRWQRAINQQILLNRMERENCLLKKEGNLKLKLYFASALSESQDSHNTWTRLLQEKEPPHSDVINALLVGVPPSRREEVWHYLSELYQHRNRLDWDHPEVLSGEKAFHQLGQETTEYEHNITVDIGRTFPSHPYFSSVLRETGGQAELKRILHAYAVADPETGYCQGLSFVTGIILMHTKDELAAFGLLYKFMNLHGYKDVYKGSLAHLQVLLYQLSRLIHDFIPSLYHLLQRNEVTPFYYAAPWFLTAFASQYPIPFTARVFDLMFYEGTDVLFKVALSLLKSHESALLNCGSMESICIYLKTELPEAVAGQEDQLIKKALQFELGGRLKIFETEYQVMDELNGRFCIEDPAVADMESLVALLRRNNLSIIEELAICHGSITTQQQQIHDLKEQVQDLKEIVMSQQEALQRAEAKTEANGTS